MCVLCVRLCVCVCVCVCVLTKTSIWGTENNEHNAFIPSDLWGTNLPLSGTTGEKREAPQIKVYM